MVLYGGGGGQKKGVSLKLTYANYTLLLMTCNKKSTPNDGELMLEPPGTAMRQE